MSKRGVLRVAEGAAASVRLVKDGSLADFISEAAVYSIAAGTLTYADPYPYPYPYPYP
jgi:hypothetical protein